MSVWCPNGVRLDLARLCDSIFQHRHRIPDLQRVARKYFVAENLTAVEIYPEGEGKKISAVPGPWGK